MKFSCEMKEKKGILVNRISDPHLPTNLRSMGIYDISFPIYKCVNNRERRQLVSLVSFCFVLFFIS